MPAANPSSKSFFGDDDDDDDTAATSAFSNTIATRLPPPPPVQLPPRQRSAVSHPPRTIRQSSVKPWQSTPQPSGYPADIDSDSGMDMGFGLDSLKQRLTTPGAVEKEDEGDEEGSVPVETLTEELLRHWWNERCAPEVLMQQESVVETALDRIQQQSEALTTLTASSETLSPEQHFQLLLIETEIEQLRHICKAYARTRMYKLDQYFDHCLSDPYARRKLSQIDIQYCQREQGLVHNLMFGTVLEGLPSKYRDLDEDEMIVRPDLDQAVFVQARMYVPSITLPDNSTLELRKGSKHFIRYRSVRSLVESGQVKLI